MSQECGKNPVCVSTRPMRTLHCGPVSHSGVCPRMSRAGAHNSGAVGGGWRKLRAAACDAERCRHSGEGRLEAVAPRVKTFQIPLGSTRRTQKGRRNYEKLRKKCLPAQFYNRCWGFCIRQNGGVAHRIGHVPADVGDS